MDVAFALNTASFAIGLLSAAFWIRSATVKVEPPAEFDGLEDNMYHGHIIVNGTDLVPTMKKQWWWNSAAAIAAAITVALQIAVKFAE
ncbi:hypothetical protein [Pseudomonas alabamensis]|uniref:hypothetical protein n=1 Tax=Pseudomonas alabamensis TaxID=3064349 RepID=UPI003F64A270